MTDAICTLTLWALLSGIAAEYDLPVEPVYQLVMAESIGDPLAVGDNGKALGLAQFHQDTFKWMARLYGMDYRWPDDAYDSEKALRLLCAALADGRGGHWTGWRRVPSQFVPGRGDRIWRNTEESRLDALGVR